MERLLPRLSAQQRTASIAAARSLKASRNGLPARWVHRGRTARGVDCVGLCVYALAQIGVACDDLADYSAEPDGVTLQAQLEKHLGPPTKVWRPGDIVLFRWYERGSTVYSNHVGMLTAAPYADVWMLLHSYRINNAAFHADNCVKEHALDSHWLRRVHRVYSLAGEAA